MKVFVFNEYTSQKGGVDCVVENQVKALADYGNEVKLFRYNNSDFLSEKLIHKARIYYQSIIGNFLMDVIQESLNEFLPDIIHIHNTYQIFRFPFWNYLDTKNSKLVLQLHNFYPFCLNSFFYSKKNSCRSCFIKNSWLPGIINGCYNKSILLSLLVSLNRPRPQNWFTHINKIDCFITVSNFMKTTLMNLGLPDTRLKVLPNLFTNQNNKPKYSAGDYVLYLGNMISQKGVGIICEVARSLPDINFIMAGTGFEINYYKKKYKGTKNLIFIDYVNGKQKEKVIQDARFIFSPVLLTESFGLAILEALSFGKPVLTTGRGGVAELVQNGWNGLIHNDLNISSMAEKVSSFWKELENNNSYYENCLNSAKKHSTDIHIKQLIDIYNNI